MAKPLPKQLLMLLFCCPCEFSTSIGASSVLASRSKKSISQPTALLPLSCTQNCSYTRNPSLATRYSGQNHRRGSIPLDRSTRTVLLERSSYCCARWEGEKKDTPTKDMRSRTVTIARTASSIGARQRPMATLIILREQIALLWLRAGVHRKRRSPHGSVLTLNDDEHSHRSTETTTTATLSLNQCDEATLQLWRSEQ